MLHSENVMSFEKRTKQLLECYNVFPKKSLGQNFMVDESYLQALTSYASLSKDDVVLEIGAGLGTLTKMLSTLCSRIIAIEIDDRLMKVLKEELGNLSNVALIKGNVLEITIPAFNKVVSNPPFHISSPILYWLFNQTFDSAVLTFQKEFVERLVAKVGSKDYSRLTVETYYFADVEPLRAVPKEAFYPPPDVDALIVRLKPRKIAPFHLENEDVFHELVRTLFTQRNRKVRNAVEGFLHKLGKERKLVDSLLFQNKRVRQLAPEDFGAIANALAS